ncbi:MAG TPA: response regulator [Vicinamibacterales bacterium]|jgi:CheY-like chemotaxis protein
MDILIVDDSVTTRKVIKRSLVNSGIRDDQIGEAGDGLAALEVLQAQQAPILVLCDVNMPRMSGEILLEKAAALPEKHVFVMVTSVATARKKLELMRLGAQKIVPKPFDPTMLADVIGPYLRHEVQSAAEQAEAEPPQTPLPDGAALTTLGLAALQSVLEQMAFTEVIVVSDEPPTTILFGASVRLDADMKRWIVRLATDARAAGELSNRITGQDPGEDEGLRLDAMRELVNMVGGDLVNRTVARFDGATPSLPTSSVLPAGAVRPGTMRGLRLVPGGHHVWLGVERLP